MKQLLVLTILLAISPAVSAQALSELGDHSRLLLSRKHLSVSIMTGIAGKAIVDVGPNNYQLGSSSRIAFGAGINYHKNFSRSLSLLTGLQFTAPVRNIEYLIKGDAFTPPRGWDSFHNGSSSGTAVFILRLPLSLEGRWFTGEKKYFYASGGASLNFSFINEEDETHAFYDANNRRTQYFHLHIPEHNNNKPWLNYHLGAGRGWLLKNNDIITAGITTNLSFTRFINGDFDILIAGQQPVYGKYGFKGSWTGVTISYIYTGSKKNWKKIMEHERNR